MSEAELHILRSRMRGGILSKARRGELRTPLPVGLVYDPLGKVTLDPDAAVQGALRHLFECFERTGSARAVVKGFAAQELSLLSVAAELEQRAKEADELRSRHVERARYEAGLARRRYLAVDPDNRLVADALEADWNEKLRSLSEAQDDYERARNNANGRLNDEQRAKVMALAGDFPRLWNDPATPQRERKRMVRLLIEDITLNRDQQITAHARLKGGQTHTLTQPIPLRCWEARKVHPDTVKLIDQLLDDHTDAETAQLLNQAGRQSGTGQPFSSGIVVHIRRDYKLPSHRDRLRAQGLLTLDEIAEQLETSTSTIKAWRAAGLLTGHRANDKNERLYEPPATDDPRLLRRQGWRLRNRESISSTPGGAV